MSVAAGQAAVVLEAIGFRYPGADRPALDGLSLTVERGDFFGVLGPNGAGKSTLLTLLCGLRRPTAGSYALLGRERPDRFALARHLGYAPQEVALYPTLTGRENGRTFAGLAGLSGAARDDRVAAVLDQVGLSGAADSRVETWSGGMQRRLNLAVALLHEPDLLVLDEPTVGVDPQSRLKIYECLEAVHAAGTTVLYTTHSMHEVERLCRTVAIIDHGRLLVQAPLEQLLARHALRLTVRLERAPGEPAEDAPALLEALAAELGDARPLGDGRSLLVDRDDGTGLHAAVQDFAAGRGLQLRAFASRPYDLEDCFLELTGRQLRDGEA